jgi:hypothetical protein
MLIPPLYEAGGGGRGCPATAACCGTMRYIGRAGSAVDVGGGRGGDLPGGGCSDDGKNSEPRIAEVGHMVQG